jgi:putative ABC transport system ATP-binding protein
VNGPRVLLADEPTGNLDATTGASILDLIAAQHAEGLTVAMVTHDASVAARAQRVVHLRDGQVVEG